MTFASPLWLLGLLAVPALAWALWRPQREAPGVLYSLGGDAAALGTTGWARLRKLPDGLLLAALALGLLGLARPQERDASIERSTEGIDIVLALDCAATEYFKDGQYVLSGEGATYGASEMADYLAALCNDYPIRSIEDGMAEDDFEGWKALTDKIGDTVQLVGDDLFVTNPAACATESRAGLPIRCW